MIATGENAVLETASARKRLPKITVPMVYRDDATGAETKMSAEIDIGLYLLMLR